MSSVSKHSSAVPASPRPNPTASNAEVSTSTPGGAHRFPFRVRYADTDRMGFAYYAHFLRWFEVGRAELIRSLGMSYREIEEAGVSLPVLAAHCHYLRPGRYDDMLAVETAVLELGRASVRFGYRVVRIGENAGLLAWGSTEHCFMNGEGKPVRAPAAVAEVIGRAPRTTPAALRRPTVETGAD